VAGVGPASARLGRRRGRLPLRARRGRPAARGAAQVDCVQQAALCCEHHITGFPGVRVFRSGHDDIVVRGMKDHEVPRARRMQSGAAALARQAVVVWAWLRCCMQARCCPYVPMQAVQSAATACGRHAWAVGPFRHVIRSAHMDSRTCPMPPGHTFAPVGRRLLRATAVGEGARHPRCASCAARW